MKYIFTFMLCLGFLSMSSSFGQEETKKVVIVKKTIDDNGKTTTQRKEASGKEADALIQKLKEDGSLQGIDIDIEIAKNLGNSKKSKSEDISIEKKMENGKEITTYKIVTENDGEQKVMFWNGDGEMPAEMAKRLENTDIKMEKLNDGTEMMISIDAEGNEEKSEIHETHTIEKRIVVKHKSDNKVSLGVMIENDSEGVVISDVVEDSVAKNSGLKSGDTILKINDTYVFNTEMLLKALNPLDKGDSAKITYLRDGKEMKTDVRF